MDNLKSKTSKAFFWDLAGRFANQGVGFVVSIFLSRLLDPSDFGLLAMVNVVIVISGVFIDSGLTRGLIQRKDLRDEHYGSVFYFNLFIGFLFTLLLFCTSDFIARFYDRPVLADIAKVMSLLFFLSSIGNVLRAKLSKELNFSTISKSSFGGALIGGVVSVIMAFNGFGVWSLVVQSLLSTLLSNVLLFYWEKWRPRLVFSWQALRELWSFSFKPFLLDITDAAYAQLDSLCIGKFFDPNMLGYYYRAKSFQSLIHNYVGNSVGRVTFPTLSQVQADEVRFIGIFFRIFHVLCFLSFLLLGILYLGAEGIIVILFSSKWMPSVEYFKILSLSAFTFPIGLLLVNVLLSKGDADRYFKLGLYKKIFQFAPFFILPFWGIKFFLYGVVVSSIINFTLNMVYVQKTMKINAGQLWGNFLKYSVMSFSLVLVLTQLNHFLSLNSISFNLLISFLIYPLFFILISHSLKLIGWELVKKEVITAWSKIRKRR